MRSSIISLLTDFGTRDHYVSVMKAVIARIHSSAQVIDITHEVEPFQIAQAGYLLAQSWRWFPESTVHVAVVDPGVGSARRALAARVSGHTFVLPDNGLLSLIGAEPEAVRAVVNPALMQSPVSRTFHGRDVFAPAAAHLAAGFDFDEAGPLIENWVRFAVSGRAVQHIDRFGNVITNLRAAESPNAALSIRGIAINSHASNYAAMPKGELFLIEGSSGLLEISEREASAASRLGCHVGDPITLLPDDHSLAFRPADRS